MAGPTVTAVVTAEDRATATLKAIAQIAKATARELESMGGGANSLVRNLNAGTVAAERQATAISRLHQHFRNAASAAKEMASTLAMFAGPVVLRAVMKGVEGGANIQKEDIANRVAGIPQNERAAADRQAVELSAKYANLNTEGVLHLYRELRSVLKDTAEVPKMLDVVARTKSAMEAGGLDSGGLVYALKAAELLGNASSPAKMEKYLDAFVKAQQVEGKTITPEALFDFAQQLKASAPNLSPEFVNTLGPLLAQEMQGGRAGTSIQQFEKQIGGGFQGQLHAAAKEFVHIGLAKPDDFEKSKSGQILGMKPGHSVTGADLANTDPDKWVYNVLVPALHKAGFDSQDKMIKELPRLFPNSNAANLVAKLIQQQEQWAAKAERVAAGEGINAYKDQMEGAGVAFKALETQLTDFASVLDGPAMQDIGWAMGGLASVVGKAKVGLDHFEQAFPKTARLVADLGVAAGLAVGGFLSLKMLTGVKNLFTGGAAAASGAALDGSALALDGSAAALDRAALALMASAGKGGLPDGLRPSAMPVTTPTGYAGWKAAQAAKQISPIEGPLARMFGGISETLGKLAGPVGAALWLRDVGELMNPTTKEGAPYRFDTATPDWREKFERATRAERELHQGADMEAHRGRAYPIRQEMFGPPMPPKELFGPPMPHGKSIIDRILDAISPIGNAEGAELPTFNSPRLPKASTPYGDLSGSPFASPKVDPVKVDPIKVDPVKVTGEAQLFIKVDASGVQNTQTKVNLSSGGESKFVGVSGAGHH